jgi:two-component system, response regulator YesN
MEVKMLKLIIADDEDLVRSVMKKLIPFDELGIELSGEASDGLEALELCRQYKPDILITDIRMPGLTGLELIQDLSHILPDTRVVIVSGYSDFVYAKTAIQYGVSDYILKPVDGEELTRLLLKLKEEVIKKKEQLEQENTLKKKYIKALPILLEDLMNKLILKNSLLSVNILQELSQNDINFRYPYYSVILFTVDDPWKFVDNTLNVNDIKSVLTKIVKRYLTGIVFSVKSSCFEFAALINHNDANFSHTANRPMKIVSLIFKKRYGIFPVIGISSSVLNISKLPELYEEAFQALSMGFWECDKQAFRIYLHQKNYYTDKLPSKPTEEAIDNIIFELKLGNYSKLYDFADKHFSKLSDMGKNHMHSKHAKEFFWYFIQTIINRLNIYSSFISFESLLSVRPPFERINDINSFEALKIYVLEILQRICKQSVEKQNDRNLLGPVETAKRIIDENYAKDISLELISNYVHLSPTYFSDVFKKETEMSFTQYKTLKKIENAKRLLLETNLNVNEVSFNVGYSDSKYFLRMFKKITGLTPHEFKQS